jgi:protein-disulfide isomerase/uncharacterized membrane protein
MTTPTPPSAPLSSRDRLLLVLLALVTLAGGFISYKLYADSVLIKGTGKSSGVCSEALGATCDHALNDSASTFLGIAWPVWSAAFYFMIFGLILTISAALWRRQPLPPAEGSPWARFLTLAFVATCGLSAYLAYINYVVLPSPCPMCTGLYIVNALSLGLAISLRPGKPADILRGIPDILKSNQVQGALIIFVVATLFFQWSYTKTVEEHKQRSVEQGERAAEGIDALYGPNQVDLSQAPVKGSHNAKVKLVEFSDFECPYCGRFAQELQSLRAAFPDDQLSIHFMQFPLSFHPNARLFAAVSICAQSHGKFWETHDALFALAEERRQKRISKAVTDAELVTLATSVGLDPESLLTCAKSPATDARVQADLDQGQRLGVMGTPTWYLNGHAFNPEKVQGRAIMIEPLVKRLLALPQP